MPVVNVSEAKTHLSRLIDAVEKGEEAEIVIARHRRPVTRLVPLARAAGGMRLGVAGGALGVPDDIDQDNAEIRRLGLSTPSEAASIVRADRDGR